MLITVTQTSRMEIRDEIRSEVLMQMIILSHLLKYNRGRGRKQREKRLDAFSQVQSKSGMYPKGKTYHVLL